MSLHPDAPHPDAPQRRSPKRTARLAGLLYLFVAVLGGWAHLVARAQVLVPDDAAATAAAIAEHEGAMRLAVAADVLQATAFAVLGLTLQRLLHHVHARAAATVVVGTWLSAAMVLVMLTFHVGALLVVTDPAVHAAVGDPAGPALLLMRMQDAAYGFAGVFFCLWMAPMAFLAARSGMFPGAAAPVLAAGSASWLASAVAVAAPGVPEVVETLLVVPATVAEIGLLLYLLVVGVRTPAPSATAPPVAAAA